ncbi:MAG: hypothetical protein LBE80_04335, partial [Deltaproteobacteria bacterium]|nr:hypothetical protein [Deltaproteobacteria bacterium]
KKILFLTVFLVLCNQGLAFGQITIDQEKYIVDDYNINTQVPKDSAEDVNSDFNGFVSFRADKEALRLDNYQLPNAYSLNLPKVQAKFLSQTIKSKRCDLTSNISIAYPVNLGNSAADNFIKPIFEDGLQAAIEASLEFMDEELSERENCPESLSQPIIFQSSFKIIATNPDIISIIIYANKLTESNQPMNFLYAKIIDIKKLENIYLSDLFPQKEASLKKLWPYLANEYCKMKDDHSTLPIFYGRTECPKDGFGPSSPLPRAWQDPGVQADDLGGVVYLSPEGLHIDLEANDAWDQAPAPTKVLIPKEQAIEMGALPTFW